MTHRAFVSFNSLERGKIWVNVDQIVGWTMHDTTKGTFISTTNHSGFSVLASVDEVTEAIFSVTNTNVLEE